MIYHNYFHGVPFSPSVITDLDPYKYLVITTEPGEEHKVIEQEIFNI